MTNDIEMKKRTEALSNYVLGLSDRSFDNVASFISEETKHSQDIFFIDEDNNKGYELFTSNWLDLIKKSMIYSLDFVIEEIKEGVKNDRRRT